MTAILSDWTRTCRKAVTCDQCLRLIQVGQRYRRQVYSDGELVTYRAHEDCDNAASEYMAMSGFDPRYDDPIILREIVCLEDDGPWLLEKYPAVAERLGVSS